MLELRGQVSAGGDGDDQVRRNVRLLAGMSPQRLREWLLVAFQDHRHAPFGFADDPSVLMQLRSLVEWSDAEVQEKFKAALVGAINSWRYPGNTFGLLIDLAYLAAYTRSFESIDAFRRIIDSQALQSHDDPQAKQALAVIIRVISGFAPIKEAELVLRQLFLSNALGPHHVPPILCGLLECSPSKWPEYVEIFFELADRDPGAFRIEDMMQELAFIVQLPRINDGLGRLTPETRRRVLRSLVAAVLESLPTLPPTIALEMLRHLTSAPLRVASIRYVLDVDFFLVDDRGTEYHCQYEDDSARVKAQMILSEVSDVRNIYEDIERDIAQAGEKLDRIISIEAARERRIG
jgi:hypothetical protein